MYVLNQHLVAHACIYRGLIQHSFSFFVTMELVAMETLFWFYIYPFCIKVYICPRISNDHMAYQLHFYT